MTVGTIELTAISNGVGLFFCILNLFTACYLQTTSHILGKMTVAISLMDLLFSLPGPLSLFITYSSLYCRLESFVIIFGLNGSLTWTCCLAYGLYRCVQADNAEIMNSLLSKFAITSLTIGLLFSTYAAIAPLKHVNQDGYCDYSTAFHGIYYAMDFSIILPVLIAALLIVYFYLGTYSKLQQRTGQKQCDLLMYPIIFIVRSAPWISVALYMQISGKSVPNYFVMAFATVFWNLQGFFNGILYGCSRNVAERYREKCCLRRNSQKSSSRASEIRPVPSFMVDRYSAISNS